ncbi:hypothetical protein ACVWZV_002217 [Bradyrhizobium sp. GM5.1]
MLLHRVISILVATALFSVAIPTAAFAQTTVPAGGTGITSVPAGAFLVGSTSLRLTSTTSPTVGWLTATSTVRPSRFPFASTTQTSANSFCLNNDSCITLWPVDTVDGNFSTTSVDYWKGVRDLFSTTSADYWKTQNNFFSTTSADAWEATKWRWATSSSDYWKTVNNFFSTTSATFFLSVNQGPSFSTSSAAYFLSVNQGPAFSTTSASYFLTQNQGPAFSTTSANAYVSASTTIVKSTIAYTWNALQTFAAGIISQASSTIAILHLGTPLEVQSGGTASTTLGGILAGAGQSAVKSAIMGTGVSFDGTTLTNTGITSNAGDWAGTWQTFSPSTFNRYGWPWTVTTYGESTSTLSAFTGGLIANSSSTIQNLSVTNGTTTNATSTTFSTNIASTTNLIISGIQGKLLATNGIGSVIGTTTIDKNLLSLHTISGTELGSNLPALTTSGTLSGSSYNGSAAVSDWGINLTNANTWTALQTFAGPGTTTFAGGLYASQIAAPYFIATSSTATSTLNGGTILKQGIQFSLYNTSGCTIKTDANGFVFCGTDAAGAAAYPFSQAYNGTSTVVNFNGGLTANASTTIGKAGATSTVLGNPL